MKLTKFEANVLSKLLRAEIVRRRTWKLPLYNLLKQIEHAADGKLKPNGEPVESHRAFIQRKGSAKGRAA